MVSLEDFWEKLEMWLDYTGFEIKMMLDKLRLGYKWYHYDLMRN